MTERMTVSYQGAPCYDIVISGGFDGIAAEIGEKWKGRKACIVTDDGVGPLYASQLQGALEGAFSACEIFTFPAGEEHKTLDTVQELYAFLIGRRFALSGAIYPLFPSPPSWARRSGASRAF